MFKLSGFLEQTQLMLRNDFRFANNPAKPIAYKVNDFIKYTNFKDRNKNIFNLQQLMMLVKRLQ
jgi:hypothetical protein